MRSFTMSSLRSRFALPAVIGVVIALVVPAEAQDISDLRRQREQARAAEQEALEQIDLLRADDAIVAETLAEIQGLVDAQTARVAGAQQALAAAIVNRLAEDGIAYDIAAYRTAPPGLRIWGGATVQPDDTRALLPWIDQALTAALDRN